MATLEDATALHVGGRPVSRVYRGSSMVWDAASVAPVVEGATTLGALVYNQYGAPLRPDSRFPGWGAHEGRLGGVNPTFDWASGARPGPRPNDTTNRGFEGVNYTHHNVWGQVVPAAEGAGERRVRVQVELPRVYHRAAGASSWVQVRGTAADVKNFEGGYWSGSTFSKIVTMASGAHFRSEAIGHSFDVAPMTHADGSPNSNSIAHWYYSGFFPRLRIPVGTQVAIYTRMRLIPAAAGVDVSRARYLGCFSGDLFTGETTNVGANGRNPPLAITRHRMLTAKWLPFSYVSGTEAELLAAPPLPFLR